MSLTEAQRKILIEEREALNNWNSKFNNPHLEKSILFWIFIFCVFLFWLSFQIELGATRGFAFLVGVCMIAIGFAKLWIGASRKTQNEERIRKIDFRLAGK